MPSRTGSRNEKSSRVVQFEDSSSSEDEYEYENRYWNKEKNMSKKHYKKYDHSKDKKAVERYYDEDVAHDFEGSRNGYKHAHSRNDEYGTVGNSISSMFSAKYWYFTIFILFEIINIAIVWWVYWAVNGEHNLHDIGKKSYEKGGKAWAMYMAALPVMKTLLKHTLNQDDVYTYMALAIFVTIAGLYNMTLIAVMRNSKHLPIVIGIKAICCMFFLGIVIYENVVDSPVKMLLRILGLDWGYTYGVPACIALLCFNLGQIAFIWIMFFLGREREIDEKNQERRALLAAEFDDSYSRKNSKKNSNDSDSEDSDIESGKGKKSKKGKKGKNSSKKEESKKEEVVVNNNNYETVYNLPPQGGLYGFNNLLSNPIVEQQDPVVHRIVLQPQQQQVVQQEPTVTYVNI